MQEPNFFSLTEEQTYANRRALSKKLDFAKKVCDLAAEDQWFADIFGISTMDASFFLYEIELMQEKMKMRETPFEE